MRNDPIVDEIRKIREEYAAKFKFDLKAIYRDLQEKERTSGRQYVEYLPPNPQVKREPPS